MNDKKIILIVLKILDQIQQDNENARKGIEKSIAAISKEESFLFFFFMLYLLVINHPLAL